MNRKRLTQRINDELVKIESTVDGIAKALEDIEVLPAAAKQYIEETIANKLADVYKGIERIFERIAREVDTHVPTGEEWHKKSACTDGRAATRTRTCDFRANFS